MSGARAAIVGVVATVSFGLALGLRKQVDVWPSTALAAVLSGGLALAVAHPTLRSRLRGGWRPLVVGPLAGGVLVLLTHLLYRATSALAPGITEEVAQLYASLEAWPGPIGGLPVLVLAVIAEELVWRGVLLEALLERAPRAAAAAVATGLYALPQAVTGSWIPVALALGLGAVWTAQRLRSGGLLEPLLCHLVWSTAVFAGGLVAPG